MISHIRARLMTWIWTTDITNGWRLHGSTLFHPLTPRDVGGIPNFGAELVDTKDEGQGDDDDRSFCPLFFEKDICPAMLSVPLQTAPAGDSLAMRNHPGHRCRGLGNSWKAATSYFRLGNGKQRGHHRTSRTSIPNVEQLNNKPWNLLSKTLWTLP
jgi:hypothetical protein